MGRESDSVLDLRGEAYARLWWRTVRQARRLVRRPERPAERWSTRLRALGSLRKPVFILGCPRSGTTFLGDVLAHLPGASYYYEPPLLKYFARLVYQGVAGPRQQARLYRRALRLLLLAAPGSGPRVVEKNPKHTWVAEALLRVFPDARFVVITRDGRDVAASLLEKPWHRAESAERGLREPGGYLYGPYPHFYIEPSRAAEYEATSDVHRCIWIWRRYAEEVERLAAVLPPGTQHHVRYEALVARPEETVEGVLDFLGERDPSARTRVRDVARTARESSVGRWRETLNEADLEVIEADAGEMLRRLGYGAARPDPRVAERAGG